jgi:hypothetical protein
MQQALGRLPEQGRQQLGLPLRLLLQSQQLAPGGQAPGAQAASAVFRFPLTSNSKPKTIIAARGWTHFALVRRGVRRQPV